MTGTGCIRLGSRRDRPHAPGAQQAGEGSSAHVAHEDAHITATGQLASRLSKMRHVACGQAHAEGGHMHALALASLQRSHDVHTHASSHRVSSLPYVHALHILAFHASQGPSTSFSSPHHDAFARQVGVDEAVVWLLMAKHARQGTIHLAAQRGQP